jgi:hypothetical protein
MIGVGVLLLLPGLCVMWFSKLDPATGKFGFLIAAIGVVLIAGAILRKR